ncbi:hypothetical protein ACF1GT_19265 [Streptomyces sp. NPDC014636]|uniref:hypothetical protein n=1 Tax=Streptomyces sp. NPDC014636 TaxID=3364876 RepID=UPI0037020D58
MPAGAAAAGPAVLSHAQDGLTLGILSGQRLTATSAAGTLLILGAVAGLAVRETRGAGPGEVVGR